MNSSHKAATSPWLKWNHTLLLGSNCSTSSTQASMKSHLPLWPLTLLFALSTAYAQPIALLGDATTNCNNDCRNNDADALFPKGSKHVKCSQHCEKMPDPYKYDPPSPGVRPSGNNRAFVLLEPLIYKIGTSNIQLVVPAGFVTDYASIPSKLWSLYSPHDQYSRAAIVHDYLYWARLCTREQSDNLFMIAMKESEVPTATRNVVYLGVRTLGASSWKRNQDEHAARLPKFVPVGQTDFPPNWSWEMYRRYLVSKGVKDPAFAVAGYCSLGNTTDIPKGGNATYSPTTASPTPMVVRALRGNDDVLFKRGPE